LNTIACGEEGPTVYESLIPQDPELPSEARQLTQPADEEGPTVSCPEGSNRVVHSSLEQWCTIDHIKNGPYMEWFDNESRKTSGEYSSGKKDGQWTEWYEDGATRSTGFYKNDRKHGSWTTFQPNGGTESKGDYLNGREAGIWTYYHENGTRSVEGSFVNGQKNGQWRSWNDDGKPATLEVWQSGKQEH